MTKTQSLNLYKKLYLIRKAEEKIIKNYQSDEMKTPMHMSMGEEAIVVGACEALGKTAQTFGTYRSHALYLAVTEDTDGFFAEMYGRKTGAVKGKGGSMHLSYPDRGLLATSAVVASTIPLAVGAAFSNLYKKQRRVVAVFFGDGAVDEGVFWESLNIACLMKLSIIFVCEDNDYAVHTKKLHRRGYKSISNIVEQFNCKVYSSDSTDVEEIFKISKNAARFTQNNKTPVFLNFKYYRYLEHVGVNWDFDKGYRSEKEFQGWQRRDPLILQKRRLSEIKKGEEIVEKIEKSINQKIEKSVLRAKKSPFPSKNELLKDVFYEHT